MLLRMLRPTPQSDSAQDAHTPNDPFRRPHARYKNSDGGSSWNAPGPACTISHIARVSATHASVSFHCAARRMDAVRLPMPAPVEPLSDAGSPAPACVPAEERCLRVAACAVAIRRRCCEDDADPSASLPCFRRLAIAASTMLDLASARARASSLAALASLTLCAARTTPKAALTAHEMSFVRVTQRGTLCDRKPTRDSTISPPRHTWRGQRGQASYTQGHYTAS